MDTNLPAVLDTSTPVVSGLIRKRAELAGELEALHARIPALVAALNSVDATIRLFSPDLPLDEIAPKRARPRQAARPGQISRVIAPALREAGQPLTTQDLTLRVMEAHQLNVTDRNLFLTMQKRVLSSLRNLRMGETVRSDREAGGNLRWQLLGDWSGIV